RWWRLQPFHHRSNETIAALGKRFDESWIVCLVAQGLAQFLDGRVQAVIEVHESVFGPKPLAKLLSRDHLPGLLQQHRQYLEGLLLKLDPVALLGQLPRTQV